MKDPVIFISYSHDSHAHAKKVRSFADQLIRDGLNCILDQYKNPPAEGWPLWMERNISNADYVLMICTQTYNKRIMGTEKKGTGRGVKWEGKLIYNAIYQNEALNTKFIPVLFDKSNEKYIPSVLGDTTFYSITDQATYDELYRRLSDQPIVVKPAIGTKKRLSPEKSSPFFKSLTRLPENTKKLKPVLHLILLIAIILTGLIIVITIKQQSIHNKMIYIQGGNVTIGRNGNGGDDTPQRSIFLSPYYIDAHEVTVGDYLAFCRKYNMKVPPDPGFPNMPGYYTSRQWHRYPAVNITREEAACYCEKNGKRLPTEAEWENAARSSDSHNNTINPGTKDPPSGNYPDLSLQHYYASYQVISSLNDGYPFTSPIAAFESNHYGIYDLTGNVSEWCLDSYAKNFYRTLSSSNPCNTDDSINFGVIRGSSWATYQNSITERNFMHKNFREKFVGFRCVKQKK